MEKVSLTLTVLFETPFWIGVFEYQQGEKLAVARVIFGKEPKQSELYEFIMNQYHRVIFSAVVETEKVHKKKINPKRLQRLAKEKVSDGKIGTKSQQILKRQQEEKNSLKKKQKSEKRVVEKQKQFELKQKKRYEKHRGH